MNSDTNYPERLGSLGALGEGARGAVGRGEASAGEGADSSFIDRRLQLMSKLNLALLLASCKSSNKQTCHFA